jgi:hypothetical protein
MRRTVTVEDRPHQEPLTDELLAEADAESDLLDADIEDVDPSSAVADRQAIRPQLDPQDLVEAEAEADLVDADIEDA